MGSQDLARTGISADLAVHYVKAGWLIRLAHGVYGRPGETLELHPCLRLLQRRVLGLHVGGKSALDWYGVRHYVAQRPITQLYGWNAAKLPGWFTTRFPADYHRKRLFNEEPTALQHVGWFERQKDGPLVSAPERAVLELLSDVGVRQPLQEAREVLQSTYTLRAPVLQQLLSMCSSVKTVRLCLQLGRETAMPWARLLDPHQLPLGSNSAWVSRTSDGLLVLKR